MLGGNQVATISQPQGRWNRGPNETCPPDHCIDEQNLVFEEGQVGSRLSIDEFLNDDGAAWDGSIKRVHIYRKVGQANTYLILDSSGNIYDSTDLDTPILTVAGMTDFACITMFNRAYISPSDGKNGKSSEKVYVYTGSGSALAAAGSPPSGFSLGGVENVAAGKVEKGDHLFAIAYETASGFITAPGLESGEYVKVTSTGDKKVDLSLIPVGPAGTVARHVLATTLLPVAYNGNPKEQAWYFVPDGRIGDNTTTVYTANFFDADLIVQADYLQYQLAELPPGAKLASYQGRLVIIGPDVNDNLVWVSKSGEPESISELKGYLTVDPGDMGGGVRNGFEHRGVLYLTKDSRTYATTDNGSDPTSWEINLIDASIGCNPMGDSALLDTKGVAKDQFVIAHRTGLHMFNGGYPLESDLAYKIRDDWRAINPLYFHLVQVVMDPVKELIYVSVPLNAATEPSHVFVGNYQQGFTKDAIRWSKWVVPKKPTSIFVEVKYSDQTSHFRYGSSEDHIYAYGTGRTDLSGSTNIDAYARFGFVTYNKEGAVNHYTALRARVRGSGTLLVSSFTLDDAVTTNHASFTLATAPGRELMQWINVESEELSVKVRVNGNGHYFTLTHLRLAGNTRWSTRPYV